MKALIAGITGFVGGHLAKHLLASGDEVVGASQNGRWPADFQLPIPLIGYDLNDEFAPEVVAAIDRFAPDVIFHLAGISIPNECGTSGEPNAAAWNANVEGMRRTIRLANSLSRRARVVFTSSSHVYGIVPTDDPVVSEQTPCTAQRYGKTKLAAEDACRAAARDDGADIVIVRSFSQAGERQDPRLMLAEWSAALARREPNLEIGNDRVTIDLLDVRDAVRALRLLALHGASGTAYNVGSGVPRTTGELLGLLQRAAGDSQTVRVRSSERRSDPVADIARLQAATGWRPEIAIEETVAVVWNYWRERMQRESS